MILPQEAGCAERLAAILDARQHPSAGRVPLISGGFWFGQTSVIDQLEQRTRWSSRRVSAESLQHARHQSVLVLVANQLGFRNAASFRTSKQLLEAFSTPAQLQPTLLVFENIDELAGSRHLGELIELASDLWSRRRTAALLPVLLSSTPALGDDADPLQPFEEYFRRESLLAPTLEEWKRCAEAGALERQAAEALFEDTAGHPWFLRRALDQYRLQGRLLFDRERHLLGADRSPSPFDPYFRRLLSARPPSLLPRSASMLLASVSAPSASAELRRFGRRFLDAASGNRRGALLPPPVVARWLANTLGQRPSNAPPPPAPALASQH